MKLVYLFVLTSLSLFSCTSSKEIKNLETRLAKAENDLLETKTENEALKTKITELEAANTILVGKADKQAGEIDELTKKSQSLETELEPYRQEEARLLAIKKDKEAAQARELEEKAKKLQEELNRPIIPILVDNLYPDPREGKSRATKVQGTNLLIERGGEYSSLFSNQINHKNSKLWIEAAVIGKRVQVKLFISLGHQQKASLTRDLDISAQTGFAIGKSKTYVVFQKGSDYRETWSWDLSPPALNALFEEAQIEGGAIRTNHPLFSKILFEKNWAALEMETALAQYDLSL